MDYCKKQLDFIAVNTEIILSIVKNGRLIGEESKSFLAKMANAFIHCLRFYSLLLCFAFKLNTII